MAAAGRICSGARPSAKVPRISLCTVQARPMSRKLFADARPQYADVAHFEALVYSVPAGAAVSSRKKALPAAVITLNDSMKGSSVRQTGLKQAASQLRTLGTLTWLRW